MIYTVSANPNYLPKNVWLCQAYVPKGGAPKFTAHSHSAKKWGNGHEIHTKVKFTEDQPPFSVYTKETYDSQHSDPNCYYLDLDNHFVYKGLLQIPWEEFRSYLASKNIKLSLLQLAQLFEKPESLQIKVEFWNNLISQQTPLDLESILDSTQEQLPQPEPANGNPEALEAIYEEMKKQAFSFDTLLKVKKPHINPYKWVLSGGKVTYTPTEQVATDGKPEF